MPEHDPSRLLAEWGNCMRHHGDPDQADPTINAGQAIQVVQPAGYLGTIYGPSGNSSSGAGVVCQAYLSAASAALRGGRPLPSVNLAAGDRYAACMRTHGVPSFPDFGGIRSGSPGSGGGPGSNGPFDPSSPIFERAAAACDRATGSHMPTLNGSVTLPGEIEFSFAGGPVTSIEF